MTKKRQTIAQIIQTAPEEEQRLIFEAIEEFLNQVQELADDKGEEAVKTAIEKLLPGLLDLSKGADQFEGDSRDVVINEALPAAASAALPFLGKAVGKIGKGLWSGIKKLFGFGAGAGATGAALAGFKGIDQDVNIADVTTKKPLPVDVPDLEKLISATNSTLLDLQKTISQTQDMLTKKLDDLDVSVDTVAATATGVDPAAIDAAQDSGVEPVQSPSSEEDRPRSRKYKAPQRKAFNPLGGVLDKIYDIERTGKKPKGAATRALSAAGSSDKKKNKSKK